MPPIALFGLLFVHVQSHAVAKCSTGSIDSNNHVQPFMSHCAIESPNVDILNRLAGLNVHQGDLVLIRQINQTLR